MACAIDHQRLGNVGLYCTAYRHEKQLPDLSTLTMPVFSAFTAVAAALLHHTSERSPGMCIHPWSFITYCLAVVRVYAYNAQHLSPNMISNPATGNCFCLLMLPVQPYCWNASWYRMKFAVLLVSFHSTVKDARTKTSCELSAPGYNCMFDAVLFSPYQTNPKSYTSVM